MSQHRVDSNEVFAADIARIRPQVQMLPSMNHKCENIIGNVLTFGTGKCGRIVAVEAVSLILSDIPGGVVALEACQALDVPLLAENAVLGNVAH